MEYICNFDKDRDIQEVVPGLDIDIQAAIDSGVVLDTGVIEEYNDICDSSSVHTRVRDVFHAIELKKAYLSSGQINKSNLSGSNEGINSTFITSTSSAGASAQQE